MFERYTERARRVIFFARYEASQLGQPDIESEHLLLGIIREAPKFMVRILGSQDNIVALRTEIQERARGGKRISTSLDLPLSAECKRILAYVAEEAERLSVKVIEVTHLVLGILREKGCVAAGLLVENGVNLEQLRDTLHGTTVPATEYTEIRYRPSPSGRDVPGCMEIMQGESRVAVMALGLTEHVPRIGEEIQISDTESGERNYRVLEVCYQFEPVPRGIEINPLRLVKVTIRVETA
jgi:hypothetical protein